MGWLTLRSRKALGLRLLRRLAHLTPFILAFAPILGLAQEVIDRRFDAQGGPYRVQEDLEVPFGEIWEVGAGTRFCFESGVSFKIDGVLIAQGEPERKIIFTACDPSNRWGGMTFADSRSIRGRRSTLHHVIVEYAQKSSQEENGSRVDAAGGGLAAVRSDLDVFGAVIRHNSSEIGGGVYIGQDSDISIEHSVIYDNTAIGSNYIYSGGGGLYVQGARSARILRNVLAQNKYLGNNYSNEEGGGGVYLLTGPIFFAFNLVVGNSSGKGAGLLINNQSIHSLQPRTFIANVVVYNFGSLNFEQVALQTRESFEVLHGVGEWSPNVGQFPFVAHLDRNRLADYVFNGSKTFLDLLRRAPDADFAEQITNMARSTIFEEAFGEAFLNAKTCDGILDYGPIKICDVTEKVTLSTYIGRLGDTYRVQDLARSLLQMISLPDDGPLTSDDRVHLGKLISPAPRSTPHGDMDQQVVDPVLSDLVFGDSEQRTAAVELIVQRTGRSGQIRRGSFPASLIAYVLGLDRIFFQIVDKSAPDLDTVKRFVQGGFAQAALMLLNSESYRKALNRKDLHDLLYAASSKGVVPVIDELLNRGVDPDLTLRDRSSLGVAAQNGHMNALHLLLRRGADPNVKDRLPNSQGDFTPILARAIDWFHLSSGRREIAELLVAAGGDLVWKELPVDIIRNPLELTSAIKMGLIPANEAAERLALDETNKNNRPRWQLQLINSIENETVAVLPVFDEIRSIRDESVESLAEILGNDSASRARRVAAARVLAIRNFQPDSDLRVDLQNVFEGITDQGFAKEANFERIMKFLNPLSMSKGGDEEPIVPVIRDEELRLPYRRKLAVVIGVSNYANLPSPENPSGQGWTDLRFAHKDARAFVKLLESEDGRMGYGWRIKELIGKEASKANVLEAMEAWAGEAAENDMVIFFFSGHGFPSIEENRRNYFFLYDSKREDLENTALAFSKVRDWALKLKARHVLLLLDACRSGSVGTSKGKSSNISYALFDNSQLRHKAGKIALTSSIGNTASYESLSQEHGFFTAALLDVINERVGRFEDGTYLTVIQLLKMLKTIVPYRTKEDPRVTEQLPHYIQLDSAGDLLNFPIAVSK